MFRISSKGQITLPVDVRRRLGLRSGDSVDFIMRGGEVILRPGVNDKNPFEGDVGMYPVFGSQEKVLDWVRELREEE